MAESETQGRIPLVEAGWSASLVYRARLAWANRVILVVGRLLPVFPWKRTSSGSVAISQRCPIQT